MEFKKYLKSHFYNSRGYYTADPIVVIESDDWGSQRVASKQIQDELLKKGLLKNNAYNKYDSLETAIDIENLCDVLSSIKNAAGKSPVFTANFIMENPDYDKIRANQFSKFESENFEKSYLRLESQSKTKYFIDKAVDEQLIFPQFHGLIHLQRFRWLSDLQKNNPKLRKAFDLEFYGFGKNELNPRGYLAAFDADSKSELFEIAEDIQNGAETFKQHFNFYSGTIIPPQNTLHTSLKLKLSSSNFFGIQGARVVKMKPLNPKEPTQIKRFSGIDKQSGLVNVVRNVTFEPSSDPINGIDQAMSEIKIAFQWNRPAVICTHRVNYISRLDPKNGSRGLGMLKELLDRVVASYPEVRFMSSQELATLIMKS
ncbi:hypothetical protein [Flavobacterium sp.]|uniref:hypothetical protein n=1 Tax=Flavobacterium sp. TaxID=239 RepID=UPI003B99A00A